MSKFNSVSDIDKEMMRLAQLREAMVEQEIRTLQERLTVEEKAMQQNPVKIEYIYAYRWLDASRKHTLSAETVIKVVTPDGDIYIAAEAERDGEVNMRHFPGPVSFGQAYSLLEVSM